MFRFGDPGGRIYGSVGTSNVNLLAWWTNVTNGWSVLASNGRNGGSCLRNPAANNISKTLDAQSTWGATFAFRTNNFSNNGLQIVGLLDGSSNQTDLRINSDGTLSATRNGTVLGTTTGVISLNTWTHIEWKVTIHPSAGTVGVWVNSVQKLNLTSQNTRTTANSSANVIFLGVNGTFSFAVNWDYDDIIIYDGQTTDANGFSDITGPIGDCRLSWLQPSAAGTTTQFTSDSGSNYARVNEATPDGDTSYIDGVSGNIDTYTLADLPSNTATVKSIMPVFYARKTDIGSRSIQSYLRSAGGTATHATSLALGDSYQYLFAAWGQNPNNGSPVDWTPTSVNALEAGQIVS